ncbi:MAG TPA: zinc-binding dehydrogenase [Solirubrobacterales bacterium]
MRAVFVLGDEQVVVREIPDPKPGPRQVTVRVKTAGICGSDLLSWHGGPRQDLADAGGDALVPGHEASGVVELVGDGVTGLRPGDRVVVWAHCAGDCARCAHTRATEQWFCREGGDTRRRPNQGGDAEILLAQDWQCLRLPSALDFDAGSVLACDGGTAYQCLRRLDVTESQTVAILGGGPLGLATLMFARAMGARTIVAESIPDRLELARSLGADAVIDAAREDAPAAIRELSGGRGADAVFECSGSDASQRDAIEAVRPGGGVGYAGYVSRGGRPEGAIDPAAFIWKQATLVGCSAYPPSLFPEVARFAVERRLRLEDLVTHRFRLDDAAEAFRLAGSRRSGKVLLDPSS